MRRGTRVANAYAALTVDGSGINEDIIDGFEDAGPGVEKVGEEHGERYGDSFGEGFASRMRSKFSESRLGSMLDAKSLGSKSGDEAGETFVDRITQKVRESGDKITSELSDRLASNPEGVRRGIDRAFNDDMLDRIGDRIGSRITDAMADVFEVEGEKLGARLGDGVEKGVSRNRKGGIGDVIGRMLGAGSRNNGLNLIGRSIGGVVNLTEKAAKFATGFSNGLASAAEGASLVTRVLSGFAGAGFNPASLAKGFGGLATTLPVLAISLGAVLFAASAVVSVLGALLAIVIALSATIVSALVGALAVAGPLLGAFVAAAGLLTVAFTSMTEAQRNYLTSAFEPFHQAITGVGQLIFTEFTKPLYDGRSAIQVWSSNLVKAITPLGGLAEKMGGAFARAGITITGALSGPGFKAFFNALGKELPTIIDNLSSALGGFLNGVTGMFAAILPYVTQFTGYLDDAATRFSNFANSKSGRNAIVDFVSRAVDSLKSLWGFLKEVGGLLADVLFNKDAQNAGNGMFDGMSKSLQRFRGWLQKQDLKKWFEDAREFGRKASKALGNFIDLITDLYEDGTLTAIGDGLSAMGDAFKFIDKYISPVVKIIANGLVDALEDALDPIYGLIDAVDAAVGAFNRLKDAILGANQVKIPSAPGPNLSPFSDPPTNPFDIPGETRFNPTAFTTGLQARLVNGFAKFGPTEEELMQIGEDALAQTLEENGGHQQASSGGKGGKGGSSSSSSASTGKGGKGGKGKLRGALVLPEPGEWLNPFLAFAAQVVKALPTLADEIRASFQAARDDITGIMNENVKALQDLMNDSYNDVTALLTSVGKDMITTVVDASSSLDPDSIFSSFTSMIEQATESAAANAAAAYAAGQSAIANAIANGEASIASAIATADALRASGDQGVANAAAGIAAASNKKELRAAMLAFDQAKADRYLAYSKAEQLVRDAQDNAKNMIAQAEAAAAAVVNGAAAAAGRIANANAIIERQAVLTASTASMLAQGFAVTNATLADYAEARRQVTERLEAANVRLNEAIALREGYYTQVADSVRSFGSIMEAQAKTVDGIQQALTANDITDNLRDRLTKIKAFQENLRLLLANGLSQDAYKQLVDAGVETGGSFAEAILSGGQGSISEVNDLTKQIGDAADVLGDAASSHLYQAGVDAAQGLVDGLTSLSQELETAATGLGLAIATAIRNALGIASPSRVLIADMEHVGDGAVVGLDNQRVKVSAASARLAGAIAVSPEVAAYEARQRSGSLDTVSGNSSGQRDVNVELTINTPTEDPKAVANEAINELVAVLP